MIRLGKLLVESIDEMAKISGGLEQAITNVITNNPDVEGLALKRLIKQNPVVVNALDGDKLHDNQLNKFIAKVRGGNNQPQQQTPQQQEPQQFVQQQNHSITDVNTVLEFDLANIGLEGNINIYVGQIENSEIKDAPLEGNHIDIDTPMSQNPELKNKIETFIKFIADIAEKNPEKLPDSPEFNRLMIQIMEKDLTLKQFVIKFKKFIGYIKDSSIKSKLDDYTKKSFLGKILGDDDWQNQLINWKKDNNLGRSGANFMAAQNMDLSRYKTCNLSSPFLQQHINQVNVSGLYGYVENDKVKYIGKTGENNSIYNYFLNQYGAERGNIGNVIRKGQNATRIKVNSYICNSINNGKKVKILAIPLPNASNEEIHNLERRFIAYFGTGPNNRPAWNATNEEIKRMQELAGVQK